MTADVGVAAPAQDRRAGRRARWSHRRARRRRARAGDRFSVNAVLPDAAALQAHRARGGAQHRGQVAAGRRRQQAWAELRPRPRHRRGAGADGAAAERDLRHRRHIAEAIAARQAKRPETSLRARRGRARLTKAFARAVQPAPTRIPCEHLREHRAVDVRAGDHEADAAGTARALLQRGGERGRSGTLGGVVVSAKRARIASATRRR